MRADRAANWSADDVRARFEFGLRCAFAHGTVAIRTHLDSPPPQHRITWPLFCDLRAEWADRITLQAVSLVSLDDLRGAFAEELADLVAQCGGVFGCATFMLPDIDRRLDRVFALAAERGLDLDFHVDETADAHAQSLRHIAQAALRHRFAGRILCGHCCSLALQEPNEAERTLALVREAGIAVVSLPLCNLYLMDRAPGRTPRWRGVTLLHEMAARGIPVALASDNCRDPFYGYGDHDVVEVFREAVRIAQLDCPVGRLARRGDAHAGRDHGPAGAWRDPARRAGRPDPVPRPRLERAACPARRPIASCCAPGARSTPRCPTTASWTICSGLPGTHRRRFACAAWRRSPR